MSMQAQLVSFDGEITISLDEDVTVVGRKREVCDVLLDRSNISKVHCLIVKTDGLVLVNPMHITASVYVNDLEYGLHADIMDWLEKNAPAYGVDGRSGPEYRHHRTGEDNGDAHLKRQLLGHQVTMPITDGRLHLGPWEQIHYAEFDGMRAKRILVKIVGVRG